MVAEAAATHAEDSLRTADEATLLTGDGNPRLHVEAELHHITVLHHVLLALHPGLAGSTDGGQPPGLDPILVIHVLRPHLAALEIGLDGPGGMGVVVAHVV